MSDSLVSIHLSVARGRAILEEAGWTIEPIASGGNAYVMPFGKLRSEGGVFGEDYLWDLQEALEWELAEPGTVRA